jgi:hypothetical protein
MRGLLAVLLVLPALSFAAVQGGNESAAPDALVAIDACIPKLDPTLDIGFDRIAARCPDLARHLERSGWAAWLPQGWKEARNDLSAGSLAELRTLVARELAAQSSAGPRPSVAHLNEVLLELGPAAQQNNSLWQQFRAWLRMVVERNRKADESSWIDRLIQRSGRSQTVVDLLTYGSLALIVLLAGGIIFNELRMAGVLGARRRKPADAGGGDSSRGGVRSWNDVERAPLSEKPRLLLELVVARLTDTRRLPPAGAMTVGELTRSVKLEEPMDRNRLIELARAAEYASFSPAALPPQLVDAAMAQGKALLERIEEPV